MKKVSKNMKFEFFCDKPQKKTVTSHDHVINSNCEWNTLSNKNAEVKIFDIVMDAITPTIMQTLNNSLLNFPRNEDNACKAGVILLNHLA